MPINKFMTDRNVSYNRDKFFQVEKFLSRLTNILPILVSLIVVLLSTAQVQAGVFGKISGIVEDSKSGEPIVGATVRIGGTSHATKTDVDGEFFIINMPVGKYDISVTSVGYERIVHKDIRVL